jgi:hypothetical protein
LSGDPRGTVPFLWPTNATASVPATKIGTVPWDTTMRTVRSREAAVQASVAPSGLTAAVGLGSRGLRPRCYTQVVDNLTQFVPIGTIDSSPAIHRRVGGSERPPFVPEGRLKLSFKRRVQASLRDAKHPKFSQSPAPRCWATIDRPSGTKTTRELVYNNEGLRPWLSTDASSRLTFPHGCTLTIG